MASDTKHLLIFLPNWLGDVVMATPAIRAVRRNYPEATITCVGKASCCDLLRGIPHVDHFVAMPTRPGFLKTLSLGRTLSRLHPNLAVVLPNSFRLAWVAWLTGATTRIGYQRGGRGAFLTHAMPRYRKGEAKVPRYTAQTYLALATELGAADDGEGLELAVTVEERDAVARLLDPHRPVVAIAPGAAFGPSKQWLPERFAAVAAALHTRFDAQCVLMTGPGEEATRDAVLAASTTPFITCNDDAPTLERLKATIASSDILIGNDSGPRHIAIAFNKPVICVMGSTAPHYTESPWERGEVVRIDVDCGPCQKPVCVTDHRCMTGVSVERVVAAASHWLRVERRAC